MIKKWGGGAMGDRGMGHALKKNSGYIKSDEYDSANKLIKTKAVKMVSVERNDGEKDKTH